MRLPTETMMRIKSVLLGAVAGAAVLALVGFQWGGWVTGGTAEKIADRKANAAVVVVLTPFCIANFRRQPDAGAQLAVLQKMSSYDQTGFVQKSGWAASPGGKDDNFEVARACAQSLANLTSADLG